MIIIGHKLVDYDKFNEIKNLDEMVKYDNLLFSYNEIFIENAKNMNKIFSVKVGNINEILIANGAGARFIIVNKKMAKTAQELADKYLFDAKIAVFDSPRHLKDLADMGIDAVILKEGVSQSSGTGLMGLIGKIGKFRREKKPNIMDIMNQNLARK